MAADAPDFAKMVPGFDFLQSLAKNAGSVLPGIGQWVAPTLDPQEIEKRINELRTVQFWLEQNARMLSATIQALEVQRMTLSTLKTMNVQVDDLRQSMMVKFPLAQATASPAKVAPHTLDPAPEEPNEKALEDAAQAGVERGAAPQNSVVDPTQWWGALTQQFAQLASTAMQEAAAGSARQFPGGVAAAHRADAKTAVRTSAEPAPRAASGRAAKSAPRSAPASAVAAGSGSAALKPAPATRAPRKR